MNVGDLILYMLIAGAAGFLAGMIHTFVQDKLKKARGTK